MKPTVFLFLLSFLVSFAGAQALVSFKDANGKYGLKNSSGEIVIQAKFDSAFTYDDGLARVKANGKWGVLDKKGKEIIPIKYHSIVRDYFEWDEDFEEADWFIARLNPGDKSKLIDTKGKELKFTGYSPYGFSEGRLAVSTNKNWGYVDFNYREIVPMKYTVAEDFEQGLARVKLNGKWGYLDTTGKTVIPLKYDSIKFSYVKHAKQTWFKFLTKGKWGLLDRSGKEFIVAKYDELGLWGYPYFSEGLMPVKLNGKWGYVDSTGKLLIPAVYDEAFVFTGGTANVKKDGKSTRIDNPLIKKSVSKEITIKTEPAKNNAGDNSGGQPGAKQTGGQVKKDLDIKGVIDPSITGTWKYHDIGSNFNSYYIFRNNGTFDYWTDMMTTKAPAPNPNNLWRINGNDLELLYEGAIEATRLRIQKKNDPQANRPALLIELKNTGTYRTYFPIEAKPLWNNGNTTSASKTSPVISEVKLSEPPVKLNGKVDLGIVGLWKTTLSNTDYFLDIKADGTYDTWSSTNTKKSKAWWRIDNGFMEVVFEGNKKIERFQFTKTNDLNTGKPTIMIVSTVYFPQTERELWKN
jgi:hypothetical protein